MLLWLDFDPLDVKSVASGIQGIWDEIKSFISTHTQAHKVAPVLLLKAFLSCLEC